MGLKEDIKARVNVVTVLERFGALPETYGLVFEETKFYCPFCDDIGSTRPAGSADEMKGLWHCWSCDRGGDIFTAVRYGTGITNFNDQIQWVVDNYPDEEVEFDPWRSEEETG